MSVRGGEADSVLLWSCSIIIIHVGQQRWSRQCYDCIPPPPPGYPMKYDVAGSGPWQLLSSAYKLHSRFCSSSIAVSVTEIRLAARGRMNLMIFIALNWCRTFQSWNPQVVFTCCPRGLNRSSWHVLSGQNVAAKTAVRHWAYMA